MDPKFTLSDLVRIYRADDKSIRNLTQRHPQLAPVGRSGRSDLYDLDTAAAIVFCDQMNDQCMGSRCVQGFLFWWAGGGRELMHRSGSFKRITIDCYGWTVDESVQGHQRFGFRIPLERLRQTRSYLKRIGHAPTFLRQRG